MSKREERKRRERTDEEVRNGGPRRTAKRLRAVVRRGERSNHGSVVLWGIVTDFPEVFESHVVPKLNGNDVKFFYDVNGESRAAIKRSGAKLPNAFKIGDFDTKSTISWALEKCSEYRKARFCEQMARKGNLELLKYAHENGCPWDRSTCSSAAQNGHLECLKYLHENGCPWDDWTCSSAAFNGHLECLKYAHEIGCPWGVYTCSNAAENGHLECLKYAHENGCPWDEDTCDDQERLKQDLFEECREKGCPVS